MPRRPVSPADRRVADVARRQHGVLSRHQARRAGLTDEQIDRRLRRGVLGPVRLGVLAVRGAPSTWEQTVMAAVLAGPDGTLASHATAARLWDMSPQPWDGDGLHVLAPGQERLRSEGIVGHRSTLTAPPDLTHRRRIPVTSAARTVADCSATLSVSDTGRVVDDLLRRRLLRLDDLRAVAARLSVPGRRRTRCLTVVLARRVEGYELSESDLEVRALRLLRGAGLPLPVQQHRVSLSGRRHVRLDLAYPDIRLGIELDGWTWHRHRTPFDRDRSRAAALTAAGWAMLAFTSTTMDEELVDAVVTVRDRRLRAIGA